MTAPTTISEHLFIRINFLQFLLGKTAREFQRTLFESSKNLDERQFLQTSVYVTAECWLRSTQPGADAHAQTANNATPGK